MTSVRNTEKEEQIKNRWGIVVEFCEPYTGNYGSKDYIAEIFLDRKNTTNIENKKRSLLDLVLIANELKLQINNDDLNTGIICRDTEGYRDTNQILFKDKGTLENFKFRIDTLSPIKKQGPSPLQQNTIHAQPKDDLKKTNEKPSFDYTKIFGQKRS